MTFADLYFTADAPILSLDPTDWKMYHDWLIDNTDNEPEHLAWLTRLIASLEKEPDLIPVFSVLTTEGDLGFVPWESHGPYLSNRCVHADRENLDFLKPEWFFQSRPRRHAYPYYKARVSPFSDSGAFGRFMDKLRHRYSVNFDALVKRFWDTHLSHDVISSDVDWYDLVKGYENLRVWDEGDRLVIRPEDHHEFHMVRRPRM